MAELQISNYCDLFGFNSKKYPVSRLPIKIDSEIYPTGRSEERRVGKGVDLGGRRIIKKKKTEKYLGRLAGTSEK